MDKGHGADIEPPGGLVGDDQAWRAGGAGQRPPENQFLHIAARQCARSRFQALRLQAAHIEVFDDGLGLAARLAAAQPAQARKFGGVITLENGVFPDAQLANHANGVPVFGYAGHVLRGQRAGVGRHGLTIDAQRAAVEGLRARQHIGQRGLAIARHAGNTDDLSAACRKVDLIEQQTAIALPNLRFPEFANRRGVTGGVSAGVGGRGAADLVDLPAHHQLGQMRRAGLGACYLGNQFAATQHRNAIGNPHHFVQFVADEDDGQPLADQLLQGVEQTFALLGGEHGSGFVQNQNAGAAIKRLQDFNALALANRQVANPCLWVDPQTKALGGGLDIGGDAPFAQAWREQ